MDTSTILCVLIIFLSIGTWVNFFINRKLEKKLKIAEVRLKEKDEMEQFDPQILNLAYLYAKALISYGVNVTEKWETATEQSANLEKAYRKGFYEGVAAKLNEKDLNRIIVIPNNITRKELHKAIFGVNPPELDSPYCSCARGKGGCEKCKHKDDLNCDVNWWNAPYKKEE